MKHLVHVCVCIHVWIHFYEKKNENLNLSFPSRCIEAIPQAHASTRPCKYFIFQKQATKLRKHKVFVCICAGAHAH